LALRAVTERGTALVLPGDLEAEGERALLRAGATTAGEALVAPHHGADGSSTAEFLAAVGARIVAISAGSANRFGHPGKGALERFAATGARVVRTDRDGTIVLEDGASGWRLSGDDDRSRDEGEDEDRRE
jgi:competence protein ComEC